MPKALRVKTARQRVKAAPSLANLKAGLANAFSNIKRAQGMGAFVLCFCFIDWLAGYYFARDTKAEDYKEFLRRFLTKGYDPESIYHAVRCGLVHNYTDRGTKVRYDFREDAPSRHLQLRALKGNPSTKLRVINLSNLVADLENVMNELFKVLENNPEMGRRALNRYRTVGLISGSVETV